MTDASAGDAHAETWIARHAPTVSVVLPVFDPEISDLRRAIHSVEVQSWPFVELCIVDDASTKPEVRALLAETAKRRGIVSHRFETNGGIARATNTGVSLASGEYIAFLDHDDELEARAITELVQPVIENPHLDLVYSDHDVVDHHNRRIGIDLKPGWSPELLLSYMYVGHLKMVRRDRFLALGGYRENFPGAADYDFLLRLTEQSSRIEHVPKVLYHWRAAPDSIARSADSKPYAFESGLRALREAARRRKLPGSVEWPTWAQRSRVGMYAIDFADSAPAPFSLVIWIERGVQSLRDALTSFRECSRAKPVAVLLVDPEQSIPEDATELDAGLAGCQRAPSLGAAIEAAQTPFVLLVDDQLRISEPHAVAQMIGFCQIQGVAATGAKVVTRDGLIDQAGLLLGIQGGVASAFLGRPDRLAPLEHGGYAHVSRNCAALATSALLIDREAALEVQGFSDDGIAPSLQGADCVLRMRQAGYRAAFVPSAEFVRPDPEPPATVQELVAFRRRWESQVDDDPYLHPLFSRVAPDFRMRVKADERDDFLNAELRPESEPLSSEVDLASLLTSYGLERPAPETGASRPLSRLLRRPWFRTLLDSPLLRGAIRRFRSTRAGARLHAALRTLGAVD